MILKGIFQLQIGHHLVKNALKDVNLETHVKVLVISWVINNQNL